MAEKAPPQPPSDQNVLVYVSEYQNVALQTSINSRKPTYYHNFNSVSEQVSETVTVESLCTSTCSDNVDNEHSEYKPDSISPPFGWKRLLSNGIIIYLSPSNTALSTLDQVRSYVESEGTCKCGLECPLHLPSVFNFDPKIITKPSAPPVIRPGDLTKLCNHKRKLLTSLENVHVDNRYVGDGLKKKKRRMVLSLGNTSTVPNVPVPPVQTTLTPPPTRSDNPSFLKVHNQPSNPDVWREDGFSNGYVEYPHNSSTLLPSQPVLQDSGIVSSQSTNAGLDPPGSLCNGPIATPPPLPPTQNSINLPPSVAQNHLNSGNSSQTISIQTPAVPSGISPVINQQIQSNVQQQSLSTGFPNVLGPSLPHGTVRRFPSPGIPQSSCPPQPSHIPSYPSHVPQQVHYDNRTLTSGFTVKYGSKATSGSVQQISLANQLNINSHIQTVATNFQSNNQQSLNSQNPNVGSQPQVLSNHHVSNQQMLSTQQTVGNIIQNVSGPPPPFPQQQHIPSHYQNVNNAQVSALPQGTNCQQINLPQNHSNLPTLHNIQESNKSHQTTTVHDSPVVSNINRVRTPPWHQNKQQTSERAVWTKKSKPSKEDSPSFLEDPSGYLAQQTALLRQAVAGTEDEEPRTMASSHTASSNTLTSVLAGRTNTLTVSVGSQEPVKPQHFLVSGNGQFIIAAAPKVSPPSPLLLPAPLLLQPIDTVQLPQLVVPPVIHEEHVEKRKSPNKKRKLSPTTSTAMLLSPQPQQQVLTILPSKSPITNMIQPLNVVQNFPIQQFLVPSMVMSDGTILQDAVQVNLLPSTGVFSSGQNLLAPAGVVLRAPTSQSQPQQAKFLHSPNQFVGFSGELSPVVPNTSNTTVVQQNTTTIVQQTTMVQQPSPSYILDKPNFILTSDKHNNLILSPGSEKVKNSGFVRNSVSTQTQNQVVQVSSSGGLVVTTGGSRGGSPPDTTTLSPADQEVTTSVTSPDPSMVHCVSSTNLQDDSSPYHIDTTTSIPYSTGNLGKSVNYAESSSMVQPLQDKDITQLSSDDYSSKLGLCSTTSDSSHLGSLHDCE